MSRFIAKSWRLSGHVQGVGFRPFVYRLAMETGVSGWVQNRSGDVAVHAEGDPDTLALFGHGLVNRAPAIAHPIIVQQADAPPDGSRGFTIRDSNAGDSPDIHVPPDYFTCPDCLDELLTSTDRRYRYPFINCTQCGPRYTLIAGLPYDRANTSMAGFPLCPACAEEYRQPYDRRFHAEPVACPVCGPQLTWVADQSPPLTGTEPALKACLEEIARGGIVAIKGIGGYHLACDARSDSAIRRLRSSKPRPHKPLAVMFPSPREDALAAVRQVVRLSAVEAELLTSPIRPIILLPIRPEARLSGELAPGLCDLGVMLPYSPLHHLLLEMHGAPLVATSGNLSGEPVMTDALEVDRRLSRITTARLHHDRPILRPADDPVFRTIRGRPRPIRLGRGCAPVEMTLPQAIDTPILAVGGHMKNTIALAWENRAVVSPHIGDMGTPRSLAVFEQLVGDLQALYGIVVRRVAHDAHAGYTTTRWARASGLPAIPIYHHEAHASALAGEHCADEPWLVFTWDGVGLGRDNTLWGGETLHGRPGRWRRVAHLKPFRLPGGPLASREPWRTALGICWEIGAHWDGAPGDVEMLYQAWSRQVNSPITTAAGRLFDAVSALSGIVLNASYEGQGPMLLEALYAAPSDPQEMPFHEARNGLLETDWSPLIWRVLESDLSPGEASGHLHHGLARAIVQQALALRNRMPFHRVGLCGGVFQNRVLTELACGGLEREGFDVALPGRLPGNDAAISFGQLVELAAADQHESSRTE